MVVVVEAAVVVVVEAVVVVVGAVVVVVVDAVVVVPPDARLAAWIRPEESCHMRKSPEMSMPIQ